MTTRLAHDWFPRPLPENVVMGERSWCYSAFCCLHYQSRRGVQIGHDSGIYHGTFFELGLEGEVHIGNYCTLVGAIIASNRRIEIGDFTFIAHEVVLADTFAATPPEPQSGEPHAPISSASIIIGANCWIGARAILLAGTRLGEGVVVGAGAVVDFEVPPYAMVVGNPARIIPEHPNRMGKGLTLSPAY